MKIVAFNTARQHVTFVRDLQSHEMSLHSRYTPIVAEARNRLSLFRILHRNFLEWRSFIDDLLNPKTKEKDDALDELNRLLLNYLTCSYTIREHFEVSFQQRYRNDPVKRDEYDKFVESLVKSWWSFAFFLDFRGYVQHKGFGVGHYSRSVDQTEVHVKVAIQATALLAETRSWKRSNLTASHGTIDLITQLQEFHLCLLQHYAAFVARTFFPELKDAAEFYARLTAEAKEKDPFSRMVFLEGAPQVINEGSKITTTLNFVYVPNSVFEELGIRISTKPDML
jgi:hypothetical protein